MTETRDLDRLRLHQDADRVPMPDTADLAALRASLAESGQQDPLDITPDGVVLDGRTRLTLLRELGSLTAMVRIKDIPEKDQPAYIVDRAVARRHLTNEQKRSLNTWLRSLVVEVTSHPATGEEMRIGMSRPQRAEKLGVAPATIREWDQGDVTKTSHIPPDAPTHTRRTGGNPTPYPIHPAKPKAEGASPAPRRAKPEPLRKSRPIPYWSRHVSTWLRSARPEDKEFLRRLDREVHAALDRNEIECTRETA